MVWFHASSVGEYEQARVLALALKKKHPQFFIFFTVYSYSAYSQRREDTAFDYLFPLPFDFPAKMKRLLTTIKPQVLVYAKYDVWPNLCRLAYAQGIPQLLISATLPSNSWRLRIPFSLFYRKLYHMLQGVYAIHPVHAQNFSKLKIKSLVYGDTRFDAVKQRADKIPPTVATLLRKLKKLFLHTELFVAGSTYPICEEFILGYLEGHPHSAAIVVPHHPEPKRIEGIVALLKQKNIPYLLYSQLAKRRLPTGVRVLVVDTTGLLAHLYSLGKFAYVGGGFNGKVHSVLEPAFFGLPLLTGPQIQNSQEAIDLHERGLLTVAPYPDKQFLKEFIYKYQNRALYGQVKKALQNYFRENCGATQRLLLALEQATQLRSAGGKSPQKKAAPEVQ